MKAKSKEGGYYILYSLMVIVLWGLVPAFAKIGNLPGGLTTLYVNWFAVIGVFVIMLFTGRMNQFAKPQPYKKLVFVGLVWPLTYSILYFTSINKGSASLTTIANYTWPILYFILASIFARKRFSGRNWVVVLLGILAVAIPILIGGNLKLLVLPLVLAIAAALAQSVYSLLTEKYKEDAWLITFVVELVTAIGSTIYVLIFEHFAIPDLKTLGCLAFIGILSNGIGFWAFLKASQESALNTNHKTTFLVLMCLTPLVQVVLLPILGVESVSPAKMIGVVLICIALVIHRISPHKDTAS
jgi:drug/metabolite transporter (DMT)-like permease